MLSPEQTLTDPNRPIEDLCSNNRSGGQTGTMRGRTPLNEATMTKLFIFLILLTAIFAIYFFGSAKNSAKLPSPTLIDGKLPACASKPNCVNSTADKDSEHYIAALETKTLTLDDLQEAVTATGGQIVSVENKLLTAVYRSAVIGFTDDLLLHMTAEHTEVRSSSRVGYSDMNVNRKRVEQLRQILNTKNN